MQPEMQLEIQYFCFLSLTYRYLFNKCPAWLCSVQVCYSRIMLYWVWSIHFSFLRCSPEAFHQHSILPYKYSSAAHSGQKAAQQSQLYGWGAAGATGEAQLSRGKFIACLILLLLYGWNCLTGKGRQVRNVWHLLDATGQCMRHH